MKKFKKILFLALMVAALSCLFCQPAFAISEEEVQAQVDAVGKETVSGNVLIWFMCAIGFLKVSQKIDSFMASLGVNVGHTGGSMLAEAMIAAKGIGGFKNFSSHHFGGARSSSSTHVNANGGGGKSGAAGFGAGFASGGLAGVIKRNVTNNAVKTATTPSDAKPSGLGGLVGGAAGGVGGHIYSSSVSKGGSFANNVIGSVATGNITQMGTITGEKAVEALHSYMGHTALGPGAENIPTYQNVEIGGGRITGTEVTPEHPEGIAFGMYHADQYVAPEGQYTTVHAVDGTAWYKQYAVDAVDKTPYMAPDGSIAYPDNYETLSTDAALRAERIACRLRHLIYSSTTIRKGDYLKSASVMHGINITYENEVLAVTLPSLLPKRRQRQSAEFLLDPLYFALEQYAKENTLPHYRECVVCFAQVYDQTLPTRRVRDYDNLEEKQILDLLSSFVMADDTGLLCDAYNTAELGEQDCTMIFVMEKHRFPGWLAEHKPDLKSISDF